MTGERQRVLGEESPYWLTGIFGVIGMLVAGTAVWLWLGPPMAGARQADATPSSPVPTAEPPPVCPAPVTVPFEFGSATFDRTTVDGLASAVVERVRSNAAARLIVLGHADAVGRERNNFILSYRRAQAVAAWLVEAGVPADRIRVRAAGSQEPLEGLDPEAGDNRRVGVFFAGLPGCPDN
ncbi:MAG: OmpA family protein [Vicinamibacterales bacterium]